MQAMQRGNVARKGQTAAADAAVDTERPVRPPTAEAPVGPSAAEDEGDVYEDDFDDS